MPPIALYNCLRKRIDSIVNSVITALTLVLTALLTLLTMQSLRFLKQLYSTMGGL